MEAPDEISQRLYSLDDRAEGLIQRMYESDIVSVPGRMKLLGKLKAERKFLTTYIADMHKNNQYPGNLVANSSNLDHLGGVADVATALIKAKRGCQHIMLARRCEEEELDVDVVTDDGATWVKVVARNPKGTYAVFKDSEETGFKTIVSVGEQWLKFADANPSNFIPPIVAFHFVKGVVKEVRDALEGIGVHVSGKIFKDVDTEGEGDLLEEICLPFKAPPHPPVTRLNLDVTTLLAYVSNLTNNKPGCGSDEHPVKFKEPVLMSQSGFERNTRVKEILDVEFEGKELLVCESAHNDFQKIVFTVGGNEERLRALELLKRLTIVPDSPSERVVNALKEPSSRLGSKIKPRSVVIFGTGDALKIPTVTANTGFLGSAESFGVRLVSITHDSRCLSEAKEVRLEEAQTTGVSPS